MKIKSTLMLSAALVTGIALSACSSSQVQNEPAVKSPTGAKMGSSAHTHPANECTNSISHSHPNGKNAHKHRYSCKPKMAKPTKVMEKQVDATIPDKHAHTHAANRCTRSISHTHPNGQGTHQHRYSCKGNKMKSSGNAHTHPANGKTRSMRHVHPNGSRPHTHHYGR